MVRATKTPGIWQNRFDACPYCDYLVNGIGELNKNTDPPEPGDFTICIRCASIAVFGPLPDLRMRKPKPGELEKAYSEDPELFAEHKRATNIIAGLNARERH